MLLCSGKGVAKQSILTSLTDPLIPAFNFFIPESDQIDISLFYKNSLKKCKLNHQQLYRCY